MKKCLEVQSTTFYSCVVVQGKFYLLIEELSQLFRALLPIQLWYKYIVGEEPANSYILGAALIIIYSICKVTRGKKNQTLKLLHIDVPEVLKKTKPKLLPAFYNSGFPVDYIKKKRCLIKTMNIIMQLGLLQGYWTTLVPVVNVCHQQLLERNAHRNYERNYTCIRLLAMLAA